jgi:hypothetical protein
VRQSQPDDKVSVPKLRDDSLKYYGERSRDGIGNGHHRCRGIILEILHYRREGAELQSGAVQLQIPRRWIEAVVVQTERGVDKTPNS